MKKATVLRTSDECHSALQAGGIDFRFLENFGIAQLHKTDKEEFSRSDLMRAIWGASSAEFAKAIEYESQFWPDRPHIFAFKNRYRNLRSPGRTVSTALMDEAEFGELYAAAEFAAQFHLWFDSMINLNWTLMGAQTQAEAQQRFESFTKCLRDWMSRRLRDVPYAAVHAHEHSATLGFHTHMALYVPVYLRKELRTWAMKWPERQLKRKAPRSVRVRVHGKEVPWLHWVTTSYLMKGYDPQAVVVSARNAIDKQAIYLGDLIPAFWRDPGQLAMNRRTGCSLALGPKARSSGVPGGMSYLKNTLQLVAISPVAKAAYLPAKDGRYPPFRSKYEDGIRDVRLLYPSDFLAWYRPVQVDNKPANAGTNFDVGELFPNGY